MPGRREGSAEAGPLLLHAGRRQDGGDDPLAPRTRRASRRCWSSLNVNHRSTGRSGTRPASKCSKVFQTDKAGDAQQQPATQKSSIRSAASSAPAASASARRGGSQPPNWRWRRAAIAEPRGAPGHQLDNPYSLNTVNVCPVGALTSKDFPVLDAHSGSLGNALNLPGLRRRLQRRGPPAPRGRRYPPPHPARPGRQQALDVRRCSAYKRVNARRAWPPLSAGVPVKWFKALDNARQALARRARRQPGEGRAWC